MSTDWSIVTRAHAPRQVKCLHWPTVTRAHAPRQVKHDPELSRVIPLDVPNRFMLLSLLIDTPINEDQVRQGAMSAQMLGKLLPFIAVFPQECVGQFASSGPTWPVI